ncbi:hypothetical protein AAFF_G00413580 [Aldrovandia affinis]|uniref:Uncharacterized protein n=1 Tax=Aldrovandia affinis TaxID=143900 RepID=A0AAD7SB49_9TELE|nr:hypothetical protein AAFF_G00413580 [Aldrovandia affinis]
MEILLAAGANHRGQLAKVTDHRCDGSVLDAMCCGFILCVNPLPLCLLADAPPERLGLRRTVRTEATLGFGTRSKSNVYRSPSRCGKFRQK